MKILLYISLFAILLLTGCEKKTEETAPADLFVLTDGVTAAGVETGDGKEEFTQAYSDYMIQVAYTDTESVYLTMSIDRIPYEDNISTLIANFFIDGEPFSEEELCEENDVALSDLHDLLSSFDYLRSHEVIYRYLRFTWEDGIITRIDSSELNYNETYGVPSTE